MSLLPSLQRLLDNHHVAYQVHPHRPAFTAADVAAADHVPATEMAKVVVLRSGDGYMMAVLPASRQVDLGRLRGAVGDPQLHLASEADLAGAFPSCELGAMPPFGSLFGMPVWVDDSLGREAETVFNGGNHRETVHMAYADFVRLAKPAFADFAVRRDRMTA